MRNIATKMVIRDFLIGIILVGSIVWVGSLRNEEVVAELPLPIGGLMTDLPVEEVRQRLDRTVEAARDLGSGLHDPFSAISFLALGVIPSLKLTDQGLVDVEKFELVPLWVD